MGFSMKGACSGAPSALLVAAMIAACGPAQPSVASRSVAPGTPGATSPPTTTTAVGPLVSVTLSLRAAPVAIPVELAIPSLGVAAPMLAVGQTSAGYMDAPKGSPADPVWQEAFWYRGGEEPGSPGVATVAGHVDDSLARPAIFANIQRLHAGDAVTVTDRRSGGTVHFHVVETHSYSVAEATSRPVLERLFGRGAVSDQVADRVADVATGVSRLNLITCAGDFRHGQFDHRYVVFTVRDPA